MRKIEGEWLLKHWPKVQRNCNLGTCPAFDLTNQDLKYLDEAGKRLRETGNIEKVVGELGVPSGTCEVTKREVVVNSACTVGDRSFVNYYKKDKSKDI